MTVKNDANRIEHTDRAIRETKSLFFLFSSVSPAMVIAPPVEKGETPAKCPPTMIAEIRAVACTPVAAEIPGMKGMSVGPTTPSVLEKKLIAPAQRAMTVFATSGLMFPLTHADR